jgi:hypothetical protein
VEKGDDQVELTQKAYEAAAAAYADSWERIDEWLYSLCTASGHVERADVQAKITIVGRTYSAGLERHVVLHNGQDDRLVVAAAHLAEHGDAIDECLALLGPATGELTPARLADIVQVHGWFTSLVAEVCRTSPRSFASKYLHFHCPDVPVYDSYAYAALSADFPLSPGVRPFPKPDGADDEYYSYCCRLWTCYRRATSRGLKPRPKVLDFMLWQRGAEIYASGSKVT